jgi:hypothetical protein
MEDVGGNEIDAILLNAVSQPHSDVLDHANLEIFERTLNPTCCEAFFRVYPGLNAVDRDYYLSKLFQFLASAMAAVGLWEFQESLESALDQIQPEILQNVHKRFDPCALARIFVRILARVRGGDDRIPNMKTIFKACGILSKRRMTPGRTGRIAPDRRLAKERQGLWEQYETAGGNTTKLCMARGGMHRSVVWQWKTGRLKETSTVSQGIKREILAFVTASVGGKQVRHLHVND